MAYCCYFHGLSQPERKSLALKHVHKPYDLANI
uniref:Uncharacterized protein n=1 Tax=Anguilla anguilla TaxID=7936 RepID=A0A0E9V0Q7_ANGAN